LDLLRHRAFERSACLISPQLRHTACRIGAETLLRARSGDYPMLTNLRVWLNHFEYHAEQPRGAAGSSLTALEPEERRLIARSIATFQLGEQSDGTGLLRAAYRFAAAHGDELLPRITELFIRDEQRHARLLREFMEEHGIRAKCRHWTDAVFRRLRRLAGFELYLHVLIAAELIGNVYYHALESVTGCQRLRVLCRTLIADELAHVGYESELILELRARKPAALRMLIRQVHRALFCGAACAVWISHRAVLRRAGHTGAEFLRCCLAQYAFHLEPPAAWAATTATTAATRRR
jgi:rubrerythrin